MTKKRIVRGAVFVLLAALVLALAGCGGGNPKALAKQTYDIGQQALGALFNPAKAAELEKKAADIEKKVAKLSPEDRVIYDEELVRLAGEALGGLFKAAGSALQNVDTKAATDAVNAAGNLLDAASKLSGDTSTEDALKQANNAVDTAKQAADALKAFGF
jgi:hypothetical protein